MSIGVMVQNIELFSICATELGELRLEVRVVNGSSSCAAALVIEEDKEGRKESAVGSRHMLGGGLLTVSNRGYPLVALLLLQLLLRRQ